MPSIGRNSFYVDYLFEETFLLKYQLYPLFLQWWPTFKKKLEESYWCSCKVFITYFWLIDKVLLSQMSGDVPDCTTKMHYNILLAAANYGGLAQTSLRFYPVYLDQPDKMRSKVPSKVRSCMHLQSSPCRALTPLCT